MTFINTVNIGVPHRISADSVTLTVLPLFHTGGLNAYANPVLHAGGKVVVARSFEPGAVPRPAGRPRRPASPIFLGVPAKFPVHGATAPRSRKRISAM